MKMADTSFQLLFLLFGLLFMEVSGVRCIERERDALLKFKQGILDPSNRLSSWLNGDDCCRWTGVSCSNKTGHIVGLDLRNRYQYEWFDYDGYEYDYFDYDGYGAEFEINFNKSLGGQISDSLLNLQSLRYLDLSSNDFTGIRIPEFFGSFSELQYLNLSQSYFYGPVPNQLGNLSNLQFLDLNYIYIPQLYVQNLDWLSHLSSLKYLDMSGINLNGTFDWLHVLNHLSSLLELHLADCKLSAVSSPITSQVNFTSLKILDLSYNEHIGSLAPTWLLSGITSRLVYLSLSYNMLPGPIPEVFNITSLLHLDLKYNHFQGPIPEIFNITSLLHLDLSNNQFQGSIGDTVGNLTSLEYLDLGGNQFHGFIPDRLGKILSLKFLDLSFNHFQGPIPEIFNITSLLHLDLSWNQFQGAIPKISPNITSLSLYNNSISGTISDFLCSGAGSPNMLQNLDLSKNFLSGEISDCLMYWQELQFLDLSYNDFFGEIPSSVSYLNQLWSLHLQSNNLSGKLPSSLKNCTNLMTLDIGENNLSGNIPPWVGESFLSLKFLRMRSNLFEGNIPSQLCLLTHLQILDLAQNKICGIIPPCLNNLSAMAETKTIPSYNYGGTKENMEVTWKGRDFDYQSTVGLMVSIDLSSNILFGEIPAQIMNLFSLNSLNLSRNRLTGSIPKTIGHLVLLESLDFSRNCLSGVIPTELSNISFLNHLDLSNNNLSGPIPFSTQLQSFNESAFMGNLKLCGPPLLVNCTVNGTSNKPGPHKAHEDDEKVPGLYIAIAAGYITGVCVAFGPLLFSRSWRHAYFKFVEEAYDCVLVVIVVNMTKLKRKLGILQVHE